MNLREALQKQNPSLTLQRAAANEIAALDHRVKELEEAVIFLLSHFEEGTEHNDRWLEIAELVAA